MTQLPKIILSNTTHKNKDVVLLRFDYDTSLHVLVKSLNGRQWSNTYRSWYVENREGLINEIFILFKNKAFVDHSEYKKTESNAVIDKETQRSVRYLAQEQKENVEQLIRWMRSRRYSENTIGTYSDALTVFLRYFANKKVEDICNDDLIEFNNHYILRNNLSSSYQNQIVNAVKLFFRIVQKRSMDIELVHRPKREKLLPNVLSKQEIKALLTAPVNVKHRAMLSLTYSCGLRCGELLRLRAEHVDSKRNLLIIKQSKGKKDRIVPLSKKTLDLLRDYYKTFNPRIFLFEGQKEGTMYDERSLQQVLKQSLSKAGIKKPVTLHWLRHSYATHLLEGGTDLRYIQEILGHSRSTTTEIYTHVSTRSIQNVISPFDDL